MQSKNHRWEVISTIVLIVLLFSGCASSRKITGQDHKQLPNDIRWVTESIEYAALTTEIYRTAWDEVKQAAKQQTENWVVVLDVDETVLDNSQYAVERAAVDSGYTPQSWAGWVYRKVAPPVPGAQTFIDSVRTLGPKAHIAYITDRKFEQEQPTIANLEKFGLFKKGDIMMTKKGPDDSKEMRRECLTSGTGPCEKYGRLVIIALFGDNIRDFMPMRGREKARLYREKGIAGDRNWGRKYFMLPNPTYGSWVRNYQ